MKIFDCTTFYSEDLMLDVRLNILDPFVHKFIIVESVYSHSGRKKTLNFDINNFKKFKNKIIYIVIEEEPEGIIKKEHLSSGEKRINSIKRVEQSYNYMFKGINEANDDDLICISDNDEIPNFESKNFKNSRNNIFIFEQLFFYYKFNLYYDLIPWYGTKGCKKKFLKSFAWLRNLKNKKYPIWRLDSYFSPLKQRNLQIVKEGGWHFTNVKTPQEIFEKLSNFGHHNEFEESGITINDIKESIENRIVHYDHSADLRKSNKYDGKYKLKTIEDKFLPNYLISNKQNFKNWFD
tara:strand:+ start:161 stop:1039 length:879 start_codon:yes stop_codon:yes gene_type:complete